MLRLASSMVDVMKRAVELSRDTNPSCHEETHDRWLSEFHRILRPGGLPFATT